MEVMATLICELASLGSIPENGPGHDYDENQGKNHFQDVVLHVARGGELEDVARILDTRG